MPGNWRGQKPASRVIDSWAILAWLQDEAPAHRVQSILQEAESGAVPALMSWINAGGVYYILKRKLGSPVAEEFLERLPSLPVRLVLPDENDVMAAARLKANWRISFADGFAAGLAQREESVLVTGDPELKELGALLSIDWLGSLVP